MNATTDEMKSESEENNIFVQRFAEGRLKSNVEHFRKEVGDNPELIREVMSSFFALDRQNIHDHFQGRLDYARHVMARRDIADRAMIEYGLQTLKWSFLLNAGAIAVVMAYIGSAASKSGGSLAAFTPMIRELWPFVAGCMSVTLSGAAAYFNFCYHEAAMPSPETLNNFLASTSLSWPLARAQRLDESSLDFYKRFGRKVNLARYVSIAFGIASAVFFAIGTILVIRVVLS